MDMFICDYLHRKNYLDLHIGCYMYFQISFFSHIPSIYHLLTSVCYFDTGTIYCNDNVVIFEFLTFVVLYFYIQTISSSTYCGVIWNGNYFSMDMPFCNILFSLPIWQMKLLWHTQLKEEMYWKNEMAL
jgi:hypothetical protein